MKANTQIIAKFIEAALESSTAADEMAIELEQSLIASGLMSSSDIIEEIYEVEQGGTSITVCLNGYETIMTISAVTGEAIITE